MTNHLNSIIIQKKYLNAIEGNQNRWQSEIEVVAYTLKCISGYFQEKYFETTTKQLTDDINHLTDNKDKMKLDLQLQLRRSKSAELNIDQLQDCKNSLEDEMKCLRQERNDLVSLLDHFEQQLHNIKGNVRILTRERDVLMHELLLKSEQINKISCHQLPSNQHTVDYSQSSVQTMNQAIDTEFGDETVQNLQIITTERNSLRERLHNLTNENNHLIQCLENIKNELNEVKQSKVSLEQRIAELIKSIVDKENECDRLIEKVNCLEKHHSNTDQVLFIENNLKAVQAQLEKVQKDYEINNETLEKRILRLTQSVIERESENRELVERLSKSECDLKSTVKNHELLTKELEKTKNELNMLISEKQRLQSELNASYDKQSELDRRVVDYNKELTNLRDTCTLKEQERIDLLKEYRLVY
ncbi:unnamed protein product [Schistosoma mattheei]|uniref:Uncharacterized protein n=1 Tax=Schistosoma mattheei TaxID=31246 RepID=A0A3P8I9L1_9TREM|nr:unnamed protein product [Schistosoma mattheei]